MTSLGGNVSAIKITADDIICNTLTTKFFVNRNINADAINFDYNNDVKWRLTMDNSQNFVIRNVDLERNSLSANCDTGEVTLYV